MIITASILFGIARYLRSDAPITANGMLSAVAWHGLFGIGLFALSQETGFQVATFVAACFAMTVCLSDNYRLN